MTKTSAMRVRIEPDLHRRFMKACSLQGIHASDTVRDFM